MKAAPCPLCPLLPEDGALLSIHTRQQQAFFTQKLRFRRHKEDPTPRKRDLTCPSPVHFQWEGGAAELQYSTDDSFGKPYCISATGSADIFNLMPGIRWYWRLRAPDNTISPIRSFTIEDKPPRIIRIEGLSNVRDLGGWSTSDGRRIRYGLIFRGSQFEPAGVLGFGITQEGRKTYFSELGIRTELDLRKDGKRILSHPGYRRACIAASAYATWAEEGVFSQEQMKNMKKMFSLFCKEDAYPIYIHCAGGGDRTGTLAFLLETAMGVSLEDALTDYEFSNLSISGERSRFSKVFTAFLAKLETFAPGETIQAQSISYLEKCGVTSKILAKIQSIILE